MKYREVRLRRPHPVCSFVHTRSVRTLHSRHVIHNTKRSTLPSWLLSLRARSTSSYVDKMPSPCAPNIHSHAALSQDFVLLSPNNHSTSSASSTRLCFAHDREHKSRVILVLAGKSVACIRVYRRRAGPKSESIQSRTVEDPGGTIAQVRPSRTAFPNRTAHSLSRMSCPESGPCCIPVGDRKLSFNVAS